MKHVSHLAILLTLLIPAFAIQLHGQEVQPKDSIRWASFADSEFSIRYPDDWEFDGSGFMGTRFMIFSPVTEGSDLFRENINLMSEELSGYPLSLDHFIELSVVQVKQMFTNTEILINEKQGQDDGAYHKLVYKGRSGVYNLVFHQHIWMIDQEAFVLTLTCEEEQYDSYRSIGEEILRSFELKSH